MHGRMRDLMRYIMVAKRVKPMPGYRPAPCLPIPLSVIACLIIAVTATGEEEKWSICSTPQTQYKLQVPDSLIHSTAPTATGCTFQTTDGEFTVEAVAQSSDAGAQSETIDARMHKEIDLLAGTVTYQKKGDNWFVLSGVTTDGTEYYRKQFTNGEQWVTLRITYPHMRNKKYDKWVTRIEKTFVPFASREENPRD
jgi:hypothetical protein